MSDPHQNWPYFLKSVNEDLPQISEEDLEDDVIRAKFQKLVIQKYMLTLKAETPPLFAVSDFLSVETFYYDGPLSVFLLFDFWTVSKEGALIESNAFLSSQLMKKLNELNFCVLKQPDPLETFIVNFTGHTSQFENEKDLFEAVQNSYEDVLGPGSYLEWQGLISGVALKETLPAAKNNKKSQSKI